MPEFGRRGNMVALRNVEQDGTPTGLVHWWFHCPGCDDTHMYTVPRWTRSGTDEKPTFAPSLLVRYGDKPGDKRCHLFLRDGVLDFLGDCTHALAGQKVPIPEPPKWLYDESEQE